MGFRRGDWVDSMSTGRKILKPFLLKAGFALFLTLAGFFAARHRPRRRAPSSSPPHSHSHSGAEQEPGASVGTLEGELTICQTTLDYEKEEALSNFMPWAPVTEEEGLFPSSSESSGEEEEFSRFYLPDLNKLIQRETNTLTETLPSAPLTTNFGHSDVSAMEEEISNLRNLVKSFQERENYLEMQLLELHGLKEQEAFMRELQNRLKISSTETNLLSVKIESLKAENEKLRAGVSDYSSVMAELEMQRKNFIFLDSKMDTICKEAKEKITALHIKIAELTERERKDFEDAVQVEKLLKRLDELEDDVMKLQQENSRLVNENSELIKRLSSERILSPSVIRSPDNVIKSTELMSLEELNHLREENNKFKIEMEQLRTDRCAEIEELIYLRWVNACLRYEMRNYQLSPGRTVARDLSRCLSLNSEQKIKQLILEHSNSGFNLNQKSSTDFNLNYCSSQESSEECYESSLGCSKSKFSKPSKSKFLGKLKKLVLGNSRSMDTTSSDGNSVKRASSSTCAVDEMGRGKSTDSTSCFSVEKASGINSNEIIFDDNNEKWDDDNRKGSLDIDSLRRLNLEVDRENMRARSKSDLGEVYGRKGIISVCDENYSASAFNSFFDDKGGGGGAPQKVKLKKFAQVFKKSREPVNSSSRSESLKFG